MTTFPISGPIAATVDILSGAVTVIASERDDVVVEVRPADATRKADVRAAELTRVECAEGALSVIAAKDWRTYTPFGGNPSVEVVVEVPTGSRLHAVVGAGRLLSTGELGRCEVQIAAGDITIERPGAAVTAKTARGDLRIDDVARGVFRLETSHGELEVGVRPGHAARVEIDAPHGSTRNLMDPAERADDENTVQVYARNSYGNVLIRHAVAA